MPKFPSPSILPALGKAFYTRGWMEGTGGNLSVRTGASQFHITSSGLSKGTMKASQMVSVPVKGKIQTVGKLVPSYETWIHQALYQLYPGVNAVLHVHAPYATWLSTQHGNNEKVELFETGWMEMFKGIGVGEEAARSLPIFPNWQDLKKLSAYIRAWLSESKSEIPLILIHGHGVTAWGESPEQAKNYLETAEFLSRQVWLTQTASPNKS